MDLNTPELTKIFREEVDERSRRLITGARALSAGELAADSVADLVRDAHTIKGSAGLLGYELIRDAAALLEGLWRKLSEGGSLSPDQVVSMEALSTRLLPAIDDPDDRGLRALVTGQSEPAAEAEEEARPDVVTLRATEVGSLGGLLTSVSESLLGGATRVDTADLYKLINRIVEVALDAEAIADLSLVSIEGADPELFRRSWRAQLARLSESITDIQDQAVSLANVSFFDAVSTFPQFVRYLGRRSGKDVRFELTGHDVQLDRQIVDLVREPLRHLLVNAVDHGIEKPDVRVAQGKAATGVVRVAARVVDDRVEVSVTDDGAGVDWGRVAEVARASGLTVTPPDLSPILFHPGFTTLEEPTEFSGAGDGLPEAAEAAAHVHGAVTLDSETGKGTSVTLTLPLSMVLQNVVVVAEGEQFWGIPEASVEASMPLANAEFITQGNGREVRFESAAVPVLSLSSAVGTEEPSDASEIVVVNTRSGLVAITVSEIIDRRRVAVKNLGPIIEGSGAIKGAALLGGGQVLVVLDPDFLGVVARHRPHLVQDRPRILVVDDSAGVRQLLSATLNGAGFDVEVASGARDAMLAMARSGFSAMVVDYSMPRSNGVELVRAMRSADVRIPIVMVSGVATQEEKDAAWSVGVDAYLDKFDLRQGVLTKTLRQLIGMEDADTA
ncbi:MAG TPA: response regulator [Acidimicrobiia bacterium]|nr:response regulator [Acidimicrobiia bacterium]